MSGNDSKAQLAQQAAAAGPTCENQTSFSLIYKCDGAEQGGSKCRASCLTLPSTCAVDLPFGASEQWKRVLACSAVPMMQGEVCWVRTDCQRKKHIKVSAYEPFE